MNEGDDNRTLRSIGGAPEESDIERLRNTLMGLALVCTVMVCVTAIACAVILS